MSGLIHALLVMIVLLPGHAWADSPNAERVFQVINVQPNDRLNVRAEPGSQGTIIGTLAPDDQGVVATGETRQVGQATWRQIKVGRRLGWVSDAFLKPVLAEPSAESRPRVALIVANTAYGGGIDAVATAVRDGREMANRLRSLGYEVSEQFNANLAQMREALDTFKREAKSADVALLYFAGQGLQVQGENYLLPISARLSRPEDLAYQAVALGDVLENLGSLEEPAVIVAIDAAYPNPIRQALTRSAQMRGLEDWDVPRGLAALSAPPGTLVAFAAAPGAIALPTNRSHSLFTAALLREMGRPGVDIASVFSGVQSRVSEQSQGRQMPWYDQKLGNKVSFAY